MVAWRAGIGLATTSDAHALSDKSERKPTTSTSTGTDGTEELWSGLSSASAAPAVRVVTPVVNNAHIVGERQGDSTRDGDEAELVSMCLLLIVRDEESSLRANLPLWRNNADCYVFGVDDRTSDATIQAIDEVLGEDEPQKPRYEWCVCIAPFVAFLCSCVRFSSSIDRMIDFGERMRHERENTNKCGTEFASLLQKFSKISFLCTRAVVMKSRTTLSIDIAHSFVDYPQHGDEASHENPLPCVSRASTLTSFLVFCCSWLLT